MKCMTYSQLLLAFSIASLITVASAYGFVGSAYALYMLQISAVFVVTFAISLFLAEVICKWTGYC